MVNDNDFAGTEVWNNSFIGYENDYFQLVDYQDGISKLIYEKSACFTSIQHGTFFEIGCHLARYMYHFGALGLELNGIDQSKEVEDKLVPYLVTNKFKVGEIVAGDFFSFETNRKFDVVASFGFIEHFKNYKEIIERHFQLASENGIVFITIPNFDGFFQKTFQKYFNQNHYRIHYPEALKVKNWEDILQVHPHNVIFKGYVGGFNIWIEDQERNLLQRAVIKFLFYPPLIKLLRRIKRSSALYSPYYCLIVRKENG